MDETNPHYVEDVNRSILNSQGSVLGKVGGGMLARRASPEALDLAVVLLQDDIRDQVLQGEFGTKIEQDFGLRFHVEGIIAQKREEILRRFFDVSEDEEIELLEQRLRDYIKNRMAFINALKEDGLTYQSERDRLLPTESLEPGTTVECQTDFDLIISGHLETAKAEYASLKTIVSREGEERKVGGGVRLAKYVPVPSSNAKMVDEIWNLPNLESRENLSRVLNLIRFKGMQNGSVDVSKLEAFGKSQVINGIKYKRIHETGTGPDGLAYYIGENPEGEIKLTMTSKNHYFHEGLEERFPTLTIPRDKEELSKLLSFIVLQEPKSTAAVAQEGLEGGYAALLGRADVVLEGLTKGVGE